MKKTVKGRGECPTDSPSLLSPPKERLFWRRLLYPFQGSRGTEGVEIYEFAMALPLLLVLVIGIIDFAKAYNTQQVITNTARMAARTIVSTPLSVYDPNCTWTSSSPGSGVPCPIQGVVYSAANYLTQAGLTDGACLTSAAASFTSPMEWTYTCNSVTLDINHAYNLTGGANGGIVSNTKVSVSYPFTFMFGRLIGLLVPGATGPQGQLLLRSSTVMQNLVP